MLLRVLRYQDHNQIVKFISVTMHNKVFGLQCEPGCCLIRVF